MKDLGCVSPSIYTSSETLGQLLNLSGTFIFWFEKNRAKGRTCVGSLSQSTPHTVTAQGITAFSPKGSRLLLFCFP